MVRFGLVLNSKEVNQWGWWNRFVGQTRWLVEQLVVDQRGSGRSKGWWLIKNWWLVKQLVVEQKSGQTANGGTESW